MTEGSASPIRVMVVDDHLMVRRGLTTFLKIYNDLQLAGEAADGESAVRLCAEIIPDVILMDLSLPVMEGTTVIKTIRKQFPEVQIIALTSYKEVDLVKKALAAGAIGYLLKDVNARELAQAIRVAHSGRAILSPEITQVMVNNANQPQPPGLDLTTREREVLALMVDGLTNAQMAEKLIVSSSTIKSHVSNILSKLGVASRTEAVAVALKRHIIT